MIANLNHTSNIVIEIHVDFSKTATRSKNILSLQNRLLHITGIAYKLLHLKSQILICYLKSINIILANLYNLIHIRIQISETEFYNRNAFMLVNLGMKL